MNKLPQTIQLVNQYLNLGQVEVWATLLRVAFWLLLNFRIQERVKEREIYFEKNPQAVDGMDAGEVSKMNMVVFSL